MTTKQDRIDEILELSKEQHIDVALIKKMTNKKLTEPELHDIVWMLRCELPPDLINIAINNLSKFENIQIIIKAYQSDEIKNELVYKCVENGNLDEIVKKNEELRNERDYFLYSLMNNGLFREANVYHLLKENNTVYIKHEFNWNTYESRLALVGNDKTIYFLMPEIPLIGGCWSNFVAQRMLNGQMYLKFVFEVAKSSLKFLCETDNIDCKIVSCDNCFYAPYLYFYMNKDGKMDAFCDDAEKVYMDYLIKEYPKAYEWLQNRENGKYFYDDFYVKYIPEN